MSNQDQSGSGTPATVGGGKRCKWCGNPIEAGTKHRKILGSEFFHQCCTVERPLSPSPTAPAGDARDTTECQELLERLVEEHGPRASEHFADAFYKKAKELEVALRRQRAHDAETIAVLQSQVDNHDAMLEQVRMNVEARQKAMWRIKLESTEKALADTKAHDAEEIADLKAAISAVRNKCRELNISRDDVWRSGQKDLQVIAKLEKKAKFDVEEIAKLRDVLLYLKSYLPNWPLVQSRITAALKREEGK